MNAFQVTLLVVFGFLGLGAVLIFSGLIPIPGGGGVPEFGGEIVLWGTIPERDLSQFVSDFNSDHSDSYLVRYVQKDPDSFRQELVSALASNAGPDLALFPHEMIVSDADKFAPLPFESFSERSFRDSFVDEAALFIGRAGSLALPLYVDPLVMYWNRDLLAAAAIAEPPRVWEQFPTAAEKLTARDDRGNITQSAVALGGVRNIRNLKDVLGALTMQVGDQIVVRDAEGVIAPVYGDPINQEVRAASALRFYTEYSNPAKTVYSWNSALPEAQSAFEGGTLAIYFGSASARRDILQKNPHLNFDVAPFPQRERSQTKITFGRIYALGVLKNSPKMQTAFRAAIDLTAPETAAQIVGLIGLPPARRSLLSVAAQDPALDVFNRSAIMSRGWFDPNPLETARIFSEMVESVIINRTDEEGAVSDARDRIEALFERR